MKPILRYTLLAFVAGTILYMGVREVRGGAPVDEIAPTAKMVIYYFSEGKDCATCENIEATGHAVALEFFAEEIASGDVEWRSIDMDAPGNGHYATTYGLYTKSIVVAAYDNGEEIAFKNLDKLWDHVYDDDTLADYVAEEAQAFWETHK